EVRSGFGIALFSDGGMARAGVHWAHGSFSRWYTFSEFRLPAHAWCGLVLSLRENRLLGLHAVVVDEGGPRVELLGGYELDPQHTELAPGDLIVAPPGSDKYNGRIGPFGIFVREGLTEDMR